MIFGYPAHFGFQVLLSAFYVHANLNVCFKGSKIKKLSVTG